MSCEKRIFYKKDGTVDKVLAPNGKDSILWDKLSKLFPNDQEQALRQYLWANSEGFKRRFGDSVVRDTNGEPKVVYRGHYRHFTYTELVKRAQEDRPVFFSEDAEYAKRYGGQFGAESVQAAFLRIERPYTFNEGIDNPDHPFETVSHVTTTRDKESMMHPAFREHMGEERYNQWLNADGMVGKDAGAPNSGNAYVIYNPSYQVLDITTIEDPNQPFFQLSPTARSTYDAQVKQASTTVQQKNIVEKLLERDSNMSLTVDGEKYRVGGKELTRVTNFMKKLKKGYFGFSQSENDSETPYEINRQWGNLTDYILEQVVLEDPNIEDNVVEYIRQKRAQGHSELDISNNAVRSLIAQFKDIKNKYPNSIILSQIGLYDETLGIAGTADIIVVKPEGTITLLDLKTSKYTTKGDYTVTGKDGKTYTNNYYDRFTVGGKTYSSKAERHSAQLTIYKYLIEKLGVKVSSIGIIPKKLELDTDLSITEVRPEGKDGVIWHSEMVGITEALDKSNTQEAAEQYTEKSFISNDLLKGLGDVMLSQIRMLRQNEEFADARRLSQIQERLALLNTASNISELVDELESIFLSEDGHYAKFKEAVKRIKSGEFTNPFDAMKELAKYRTESQLYSKILSKLLYQLEGTDFDTGQPGSPISKLERLSGMFSNLAEGYSATVNPILAQAFTNQLEEDPAEVKAASSRIARLKNRITTLEADKKNASSPRAANRIQNKILDLEAQIDKLRLVTKEGFYEQMLDQLNNGSYNDISTVEAYSVSPIMMSNTIVSSFMRLLKEAYQSVRVKLISLEKDAYDVYETYKKHKGGGDNVAKFNEDIIEEREDNVYFIEPVDVNRYRAEFRKVLEEVKEYNATNPNKRKDIYQVLYDKNYRRQRNMEDTTITNPKTGEEVVLIKGLRTVIEEKKSQMTSKQFKAWVARSSRMEGDVRVWHGADVTTVNEKMFQNARYTALTQKPQAFEYYKFLVATYFKAQEGTPKRMRYKLPQIDKNANDRLREDGAKANMNRFFEKMKDIDVSDEVHYGARTAKTIPLLYTTNLENKAYVSRDAISSVLQYVKASEMYKIGYKVKEFSESLIDTAQTNSPRGGSSAKSALSKLTEGAFNKFTKSYSGNNVATVLEAIVDMHVYGKVKVDQVYKNIDFNQLTDNLMAAAAFTQIGGDPITSTANSIAAQVSATIDAFGGKHFGLKTWSKAGAEYSKHEAEFISDFMKGAKFGKLNQLAELYDALEGEYYDQYGRRLTHSGAKRLWSTSTWFNWMHKGEHRAQIKVMVALMMKTPVRDNMGKEATLYDAYEKGPDGRIRIKKGFTDMQGNPLPLIHKRTRNRINRLGKEAQGVYSTFAAPLMQRNALGNMLVMYKKYIIPGYMRRFKGLDYDSETDEITEGYYITFFRSLRNEFSELKKVLLKQDNNLTPLEQANILKTMGEIVITSTFSALAAILGMMVSAIDDKDDPMKMALQYPLYFALRANQELALFNFGMGDVRRAMLPTNPKGMLRSTRLPFALLSSLEKALKLADDSIALLYGEGRYERKSQYEIPYFGNIAEKGDPKAVVDLLKLTGAFDKTTNIENAIKIMKLYN